VVYKELLFLSLAALVVTPLTAQSSGAFQCSAVSQAPLIRASAHAELLGDILLDCTGGSGVIIATFDFTAAKGYSSAGESGDTGAVLVVDDPSIVQLGQNLFHGTLTANGQMRFSNVRINAPGAGRVRLRVANLRGNTRSCAIKWPELDAFRVVVSATANGTAVPIGNPDIPVGYCAEPYRFQLLNAQGGHLFVPVWTGSSATFTARFTEGFSSAFKRRNVATSVATPSASAPQSEYGRDYGTETGLYLPSVSEAGLATQGTRVMLRLSNIPPEATVKVSVAQTVGSSPGVQARLISADPAGGGAWNPVAADGSGMAGLPLTNGAAQAVWEVLASNPAAVESLSFSIAITGSFSRPVGLDSAMAPIAAAPNAGMRPSFAPPEAPKSGDCVYNCLHAPSAISITYTTGEAPPAPIEIPIHSAGPPVAFVANTFPGTPLPNGFQTPDSFWMSVNTSSGNTPASLTAAVNPVNLPPGQYQGVINLNSPAAIHKVFVLLTVRPGPAGTQARHCYAAMAGVADLRPRGLTELLSDIVLTCPPSSIPVTTDLRVTLSTAITSRPDDVVLLLNDPAPTAQTFGVNVFPAERTGDRQVVFRNVLLSGDNQAMTLRVANLRAKAPTTRRRPEDALPSVHALLRMSAIAIANPDIVVGTVSRQTPYSLQVLTPSRLPVSYISTPGIWTVRFTEDLPNDFRKRNVATTPSNPGALQPQNLPAHRYGTESGFYNPILNSAGVASQGTRLMLRLSGLPAGVEVAVSVREAAGQTGGPAARLVRTSPDGSGPYAEFSGPVSILERNGGSCVAVWEVLESNPSVLETLEFSIEIAGAVTDPISVDSRLAPLSTISAADAAAPLPRFSEWNVGDDHDNFPRITLPGPITLTSYGASVAQLAIPVSSEADPTPFAVSTNTGWLRVSPDQGVTPTSIMLHASPVGLSAGTYSGSLTLNGESSSVRFIVSANGPPVIRPTQRGLSFKLTVGTSTSFTLRFFGVSGLEVQAEGSSPWLSLANPTLTLPRGLDGELTTANLLPGVYWTSIVLKAAGANAVVVPVRLEVVPVAVESVSLSGTVRDAQSKPIPNVTMVLALEGRPATTVVTDAAGAYAFNGLPNLPGVLTPVANGYTFGPSHLSWSSLYSSSPYQWLASAESAKPSIVAFTPQTTAANSQIFAVRVADKNGATNLDRVYFTVSNSPAATPNGCHGFFDRRANALFLFNDALNAVSGPLFPGASGSIENSQCRLLGRDFNSTPHQGDNALTIRLQLPIERRPGFPATNLYLWVSDNDGNGTGWVHSATWTGLGGRPPVLISSVGVFSGLRFLAQDPDGDLHRAYFSFASSATAEINGCHGFYDYGLNAFYLYNNGLTSTLPPVTPGSQQSAENSQCRIDGATSSLDPASGEVTLVIARLGTFSTVSKRAYLWIVDRQGSGTGWVDPQIHLPPEPNRPPSINTASWDPEPSTPTHTFTTSIRDTDATDDLTRVYFLVNPTPSIPQNSCHGYYDVIAKKTYLYNDALTAASSTVLENGQCRVEPVRSTSFEGGYSTEVALTIARKGSYSTGSQNVYLWAVDKKAAGTGWVQISRWRVGVVVPPEIKPAEPLRVVQPARRDEYVVFTQSILHPQGTSELQRVYFLFNPTPAIPQNSCHGFYDFTSGQISLYNDTLSALLGPIASAGTGTLSNSSCTVYAVATRQTYGGSPNSTNFTLGVLLNSAIPSNLYLWAVDKQNEGTGWVHVAKYEPLPPNAPPQIGVDRVSYVGSSFDLDVTVSDSGGYSEIQRVYFLFNADPSIPQATCHGFYDPASRTVHLYNDTLTALDPQHANSQCALLVPSGGQIHPGGQDGDLSFRLTFSMKAPFASTAKNIYLWAVDKWNAGSGWVRYGVWQPSANSAPVVFPAAPAVVAGTNAATFSIPVRDFDGLLTLNRIYFLIADTPATAVNGCHGFYQVDTRSLYLYNDALTQVTGPGSAQNSQCGVSAAGAGLTPSSTVTGTLTLPLTINPAFRSAGKKVYLWAVDNNGAGTGWSQVAAWNP